MAAAVSTKQRQKRNYCRFAGDLSTETKRFWILDFGFWIEDKSKGSGFV
jgi:hypothetical protein